MITRNKWRARERGRGGVTVADLQDHTFALLLLLGLECGACGGLKHLADALLGLGGALEVGVRADLVGHGAPLLRTHRLLLHLHQLTLRVLVIAQILLVPHQDDGHVGAEVLHLGRPLLGDVLQTVGAVDGEAHEDDVGVWVGERPQSVVVLLAGRVPQSQLHLKVQGRERILTHNCKLQICNTNIYIIQGTNLIGRKLLLTVIQCILSISRI